LKDVFNTNMEKFSSQSDAINFSANLQNQTKIAFILGVTFVISKLLVCYLNIITFIDFEWDNRWQHNPDRHYVSSGS